MQRHSHEDKVSYSTFSREATEDEDKTLHLNSEIQELILLLIITQISVLF